MTLLSYLGLDWPIVALYLLPAAAFALLLFLLRSVVQGRTQVRKAGTLVAMFCVFGTAWIVTLSENHMANFEEGLLAGLAIVLVLLVDWFLTKGHDK